MDPSARQFQPRSSGHASQAGQLMPTKAVISALSKPLAVRQPGASRPRSSSSQLPTAASQRPKPQPSPQLLAQKRSNRSPANGRKGSSTSPRPPNDYMPANSLRGHRPPARRMHNVPSHVGEADLKLVVKNFPPGWNTWDIYEVMKQYGCVDRIEIQEPRRTDLTNAWVTFIPPPTVTGPLRSGLFLEGPGRYITFERSYSNNNRRHTSPVNSRREFPDKMTVTISQIQFGVSKSEDTMLVLHVTRPPISYPERVVLDLHRKALDVNFTIQNDATSSTSSQAPEGKLRFFKMRFNLPQLRLIYQMVNDNTGQKAWVLSTAQPPLVFRKTTNVRDTHDPSRIYWNDWQTWFRQTTIDGAAGASSSGMTQLQNESAIIDIGRWLTYSIVFDQATAESPAFAELQQALIDHSVPIKSDKVIKFDLPPEEGLWSWLDDPTAMLRRKGESSSFLEMQQMARETIHLPFHIRYQLEVCVSHGILPEFNVTKDFLARLADMEPCRAMKLLEKVADRTEAFYNPEDVFRKLLYTISVIQKPIPWYCATVRAATVTPTTIYFMTPIMETSNRVIRKYQQYEDRFLRVKFTDEKYNGKIMSTGDATMNEVLTRIKCTMINGINIAGRHYEFLAFGNSQFREHGSWFFAPVGGLTVQKMRDELGEFSPIRVVAKYCSRIGQCFTTTRATRWSVTEEKIPDIKRNGFCFTDGVGKLSPFLAQLIAQELGFPSSSSDCPSAFQFRREGCKGILVVDPLLKNKTIQIRPSQEKFSGVQSFSGLEIVRISQYSAAYLNVQLILVLSALGVEDAVFVEKMKVMLSDLQEAMHSETKALELLSKNIDYNRMTIQLAGMILDGFMQTQDPFTVSCLHLWRSWSLKYLKEKAKIFVENGAFVLGCVDETGILKGHFGTGEPSEEVDTKDVDKLPEIFLRIDPTGKGQWRVIEGVCTLMRNPSLHPGDVRVVRAVDVPALRHIKDCVVLPQTGDRDLANMCSGGDLDGDDYLVMWDQPLMPKEWNHPPMDYTGPAPVQSEGKVTVDDMSSFFVTHMKHDILRPVAVAHKYWADALPDGVKHPNCLELAQLHSLAVDYAKTGVPAEMPERLRVKRWPHWAERKNKPFYKSYKIIGQLFDAVERAPFEAFWSLPFDERILKAYELNDDLLQAAREAKDQYDEGIRRVMAKYGIGNEFEVWTTFVMEHSDDIGDYKFAEAIGEAVSALKEAYQKMCYQKAGTTEKERDWGKMGPFVAAMYTVTAREMSSAWSECQKRQRLGERWVPVKEAEFANMPFISFPWLFPAELGRIANARVDKRVVVPQGVSVLRAQPGKKAFDLLMEDGIDLPELKEVHIPNDGGEVSESWKKEEAPAPLNFLDDEDLLLAEPVRTESSSPATVTISDLSETTTIDSPAQAQWHVTPISPMSELSSSIMGATPEISNSPSEIAMSIPDSPNIALSSASPAARTEVSAEEGEQDSEDDEVEMVTLDMKPSSLDALATFMET